MQNIKVLYIVCSPSGPSYGRSLDSIHEFFQSQIQILFLGVRGFVLIFKKIIFPQKQHKKTNGVVGPHNDRDTCVEIMSLIFNELNKIQNRMILMNEVICVHCVSDGGW